MFCAVVAWSRQKRRSPKGGSPKGVAAPLHNHGSDGDGDVTANARVPVGTILAALATRGNDRANALFPNELRNPDSLRARAERSSWLRPLLRVPSKRLQKLAETWADFYGDALSGDDLERLWYYFRLTDR